MAGILTAVGEAKVALSIGGTAIAFAALRIGDGNGAPIVPNRLMTDLVRRVGGAYPVIASARDPENPTHWRVTTEIPAGEGPFTAREIAVFDAAGDMIAIAAHPTVEFTGPGGDQLSIVTDIVFPVSGAANIAVTISPSAQMPITRNLRPFWLAVDSASVTAPPANPAVGASYIVPADATGAWAGQAGAVAQFTGEDWAIANVPVGHVACIVDQALNSAGRYLRRTADAWVPAEATDLAFGFARRATAVEIAAGNGNGFVTPAQMRGELDWAKIQNVPDEFPPGPHDHDERYFTQEQTAVLLAGKSNTDHLHDDRYLRLIGGTATGGIAAPDLAAVAAGLRLWLRNVGAFNRIDSYNDPITATQNLLINSSLLAFLIGDVEKMRLDGLGRLGIGTDAAEALLDVAGGAIVRSDLRLKAAAYPKLLFEATGNPSGDRKWQIYDGPGGILRFGHLNDAENAETPGTISFDGALQVSASTGSAVHVLAGGANVAWKTLAELGVGKKIIMEGSSTDPNPTIVLPAAEPDAAYIVEAFYAGLKDGNPIPAQPAAVSGKTNAQFTLGISALAAGGAQTYPYYRFTVYR